MNLSHAQTAMRQEGIDCWLVYDFQNTNPIAAQLLPERRFVSRRIYLLVPAEGEPVILGSKIDNDALLALPYRAEFYVSWQEMQRKLADLLAPYQTLGLDYSPECALPVASRVDAGTFEFVRGLGKSIKSAANVFQAAAAQWSAGALAQHLADCQTVAGIKDEAFAFIETRLRAGDAVTEYDVQQFIMQRFEASNLFTPYPPIVGVNGHSGDPHYSPTAGRHAAITPGDWILIDLWAKKPGGEHIFADMTWVGFAGATPSAKQVEVFETVRSARDAAVQFLQAAAQRGETAQGWQVDDPARQVIEQAGYGEYFFHRTGHSLGPGDHVHGQGANIDNLETHDTRRLQPGIGFSIEPGIYLPEFGVRLEINVYMDESGPRVTTPLQQDIILMEV
ncbi:MAG: M24 family metallopeptidase [Anaerolineae bacterium]